MIVCPGCSTNPARLTQREWDYCETCAPPRPNGRDDGDPLTRAERASAARIGGVFTNLDPLRELAEILEHEEALRA